MNMVIVLWVFFSIVAGIASKKPSVFFASLILSPLIGIPLALVFKQDRIKTATQDTAPRTAIQDIVPRSVRVQQLKDRAQVQREKHINAAVSGLELLIKYSNSDDQATERRITVYGLGRFHNSHYIIAHCHLRNERRTFRLQRIRHCVNLGSGEIITKIKAHILAFNPSVTDLSPEFEKIEKERMAQEY